MNIHLNILEDYKRAEKTVVCPYCFTPLTIEFQTKCCVCKHKIEWLNGEILK